MTSLLGASAAAAAVVGIASGTGPWPAIAESFESLPAHTVFHPVRAAPGALPLFVWGNGACRDNGLQHGAFLRQIASQGYIVIALGHPREERPFDPAPQGQPVPAAQVPAPAQAAQRDTPDETQPAQILEAIDWATRENARAGSLFQGRIDVTRIAVGGHSCGGLQALAVSDDPRIDTTLVLDSGIYVQREGAHSGVKIDKSQLARLHGPMLYLDGGSIDIAHPNATDDVSRINQVPVFFASLPVGHGGTFWTQSDGGDWARVATRWLDWTLKKDADASWDFAGPVCRLCTDHRWTVVQKKMPFPQGPFRESRYVKVRDGTRLAMNVYRAARNGVPVAEKRPVIFSFTPYRARYSDARGVRNELGQFNSGGNASLLEHGYVLAVADIRGKGASFGARRGFQDRTEALDGYDLVQWLAAQPWSSGRVGMYGCSYLGGTTVHVATTRPPALRAIFSGATDLDKFAFVRNGGITAQFNTRPDEPLSDDLMSLPTDEDADGSLLRAAVAQHARNTPMAALWYGMPFRDSVSPLTGTRFWVEAGPYTYLDALKSSGIATYYWGNWEDEPTGQVILAAQNLGSRLLLGPGSHCVPPPDFDFAGEVRGYFDRHLKQAKASDIRSPRVTWWLDDGKGGHTWQHGAQPPGFGVSRERWSLAAPEGGHAATDGLLQQRAANSGQTKFQVDYRVGEGEYFAFWIDSQHGRGASFTGPPFERARLLAGFPIVQLAIQSDRPEPLLFAYLEKLSADGSAKVISYGRLAAAYRRTGAAPYDTQGLPWQPGLKAGFSPLVVDSTVELRFALGPVAQVIPAGSRLRLVITGADPRQRNLQQIRVDPTSIIVRSGERAGSWLELPLADPPASP
ncbi:MAG: CocE/NonD family hydrolase [Pseudomonadota bacterium]